MSFEAQLAPGHGKIDLPEDPALIAAELIKLHPVDAADCLASLPLAKAVHVVEALPIEAAIQIFDQSNASAPAKLLEGVETARAKAIFEGLGNDQRVDIYRKASSELRASLVAGLVESDRDVLRQLSSYPPRSAGGIMTTEFVSAPLDWTVGQTLDHIGKVGKDAETVYAIYVLDPMSKNLVGTVSLRQLVTADRQAAIAALVSKRPTISVTPLTSREDTARLISRYDLLAVPVLAEDKHIIGIVTVDDVIDGIVEDGTEDVQKFGGSEAFDEPYLKIPFPTMIKKRAGWLCALFISEMLTATAMQNYQSEIEKAVVLSLFVPLIMSSGGNSGSQATSLVIRAIALREVKLSDWWRIAVRELPAGFTLGAILGTMGIVRILTWQWLGLYNYGPHWGLIAITIGLALTAIVTWGSLAGSMLPFALKKLGFDPAAASAPFVATLVDVTGIVIYFSVAYAMLRGTIL